MPNGRLPRRSTLAADSDCALAADRLVVFLSAVIGLGSAVLDYMISNPLPDRDPEAIRAVTTTPPR